MKRASHQPFITTTTCTTKICKCPLSALENSVLVMQIHFSHTQQTQTIQVVPLLMWNVLHSMSSWWQQIQICGSSMWLIVILALCWECLFIEYSMNARSGCGYIQHGTARHTLSPITQCELEYEMLMQILCFQVKLTCAVCFRGFSQHSSTCADHQSDLEAVQQKTGVMFTVDIKMILFIKKLACLQAKSQLIQMFFVLLMLVIQKKRHIKHTLCLFENISFHNIYMLSTSNFPMKRHCFSHIM